MRHWWILVFKFTSLVSFWASHSFCWVTNRVFVVVVAFFFPTVNAYVWGFDSVYLYLAGENRFLTVARKNMRVSRDWIGSRWVNIKAREDILSFLSSIFSPSPKLPPLASFKSSAANSTQRRREEPEVDKWKKPSPTAAETPNLKKRLISRYNEEMIIKSVPWTPNFWLCEYINIVTMNALKVEAF